MQQETEPLVRHPNARDYSGSHVGTEGKKPGVGRKIRCFFAARPSLVRKELTPDVFFASKDESSLEQKPTAYLIPFFSLDSKHLAQKSPCIAWSLQDFLEIEGSLDDVSPEPCVKVTGKLLADLSSFAKIQEVVSSFQCAEQNDTTAPNLAAPWQMSESKESLLNMIQHVQSAMNRGDYYLFNATMRALGPYRAEQNVTLAAFVSEWIRSPVRQGVYINCGESLPSVCCFSPERFISRHNKTIQTEPIKGTAFIGSSEVGQYVAELWQSPKEMAEQTMVTDLLRHDLNRVCQPGRVAVVAPYEIRAAGALLQMQSLIQGELKDADVSHLQLLEELLPAGSVTGTPKWAVSREICSLETTSRGYYTGVFALARSHFEMDSSVLIRGFFAEENRWYAGVGAGITTLSDPELEVQEFELKWKSFAARWIGLCEKSAQDK